MNPNTATFPKSPYQPDGMQTIQASDTVALRLAKHDVCYREIDGQQLHIRFIYPTRTDVPDDYRYPTVVFVQGSAWKKQDLNNHVMDLYPIAKQGYLIAIVEYRTSAQACFPAQVIDVKQALRYFVAEAATYQINPDQLFLWGDSSGAHTAMMCYATSTTGSFDEVATALPTIRGYIDFCGPTDFYQMTFEPSIIDHAAADSPEGLIIGGVSPVTAREQAAQAQVMQYVDHVKRPPVLIIHGNQDRLVPFHQSVILYEHLQACHQDVTFYCVDGGDHGGAALWSQATMAIVVEFLAQHR